MKTLWESVQLGGWPGRQEYTNLEVRIISAMRENLSDDEFSKLALEIHGFQRKWNIAYAQWCDTLPTPRTWREIPAVPQSMFKRYRVSGIPPESTGKTFRSSGTTGETRGEHHFFNTKLYEASILAGWRRLGLPRARPVILAPHPRDVPDSSLAHMLHHVGRELSPETRPVWLCKADGWLDLGWLDGCTHADWCAGPVALLGTALAFLNFFDSMESSCLRLGPGSYAMETGGFKGSGREIPKVELYGMFQDRLGLASRDVWNEYGMCELSSQFYTRGLTAPHTGGPWVRALVVSPETGEQVAVGEIGVLRIFDLANLGSVLAIQTADLAIRREDGFELKGRDPAAIPRGCSRMADEKMRGTAPRPTAAGPVSSPTPHLFRSAAPVLSTRERAEVLAKAAAPFPFLGQVTAESLLALISAELGHAQILDGFAPYAGHRAKALAPRAILHVLSDNTPAAALQTVMRGLLLGSENWCKIPSRGLPEVEQFVRLLPPAMQCMVRVSLALPDEWLEQADAVIVFGSDDTVAELRARTRPGQIFVPHGHKLSFGIIFEDPDYASVEGAARDASLFDQQGCLSPHVFYVRENEHFTAGSYGARLAAAMADYGAAHPRGPLTVSESNSIRSLREEISFRQANGERLELYASHEDTAWTVIVSAMAGFPATPLNRVIYVKPLPARLDLELSSVSTFLSTCGIWPPSEAHAEFAAATGASRICRIGEMQKPPVSWHHDGQPVLAPLVKWADYEA